MYISKDCQEKFIAGLIENQSIVSVYLKNGVKLTGKIIAATDDVIFLNGPVPQMIYKQRVSTILPVQMFNAPGPIPNTPALP